MGNCILSIAMSASTRLAMSQASWPLIRKISWYEGDVSLFIPIPSVYSLRDTILSNCIRKLFYRTGEIEMLGSYTQKASVRLLA